LQKQAAPQYKIDNNGNATLLPYVGQPEPIWQLNTDNNQIWWREDGDWSKKSVRYPGHDFDPSTLSNLVDINGWTTFEVPTLAGADGFYEFNAIRAWEAKWKVPVGDPATTSVAHLVEMSRSKNAIEVKHGLAGIAGKLDLATKKYKLTSVVFGVLADETFDPEELYVRLVTT
jgi:hypothetical protein